MRRLPTVDTMTQMNVPRIIPPLILFLISQLAITAEASVISMNAGRAGDIVVTTREVLIHHLIEVALNPTKPAKNQPKEILNLDHPRSRDFVRETTTVLLENAIYLEAESVGAVPLTKERVQSAIALVDKKMRRNSAWQKLEVAPDELKVIITRALRAKDFIKFKVDSAAIPISDSEAEEYFNSNRLKFENLPFANFKDNIKAFLTKQQVDKRLKEWFELLQSKYHIRNQLGG